MSEKIDKILAEISVGALYDKISILEIKKSKIKDSNKLIEIEKELKQVVRKIIGPIATPDLIQFSPALPKTRSGKIMRRILRKIAANEYSKLGDTSTLADPSVVENLIENRKNI